MHSARFAELTTRQLYAILKLRSDVFVVEQQCVYADLDGRDTEPETVHVWIEQDDSAIAALRVLDDGDVHRIGRVCTHPAHRGHGLAARLVRCVMETVGPPLFLGAQVHLEHYYARFGFVRSGEIWDENGIPHLPMRWEGGQTTTLTI
jgi:ElaA protein